MGAIAQQQDTVTRKSYVPTGLRLGTDLIALVKTPLLDRYNGWEVSADIDFYKYYLTGEVGSWEKIMTSASQQYSNNGNYFRIGPDINMLLKDPDRNMFFVGFRYGHSSFSEQLSYTVDDVVYGSFQQTVINPSAKASWGEITLGLRVKLWKELWMGYTARMKLGLSVKNTGEFEVYDVPGYGLASKGTYWGFNYQLYWRIPFRH